MTDLARPLAGLRVLVTRTRDQAEGLVDRLHAAGASVAVVPLITTVPIADPDAIARVAAEVGEAPPPRWVAFTSATSVRLVLGAAGVAVMSGLLVAAVGTATAAALEAEGVAVDLVPSKHDADGLAAALLQRGMSGATVWFPVAEGTRGGFAESLRRGGASVVVQHIYRSVMPDSAPQLLRTAFAGGLDAITLTSGSTARNLVQAMDPAGVPPGVVIVCIGEQTAAQARASGLWVHAVAANTSVEGLLRALTECLTADRLR
jgi:uroporphyrinogen-III synthase